jgi:predicted esterase
MNKNVNAFKLFFCIFVSQQAVAQIDYKGFPEWSWHKQDSTEYFLYTPFEQKKHELIPIVLFLHGCCGRDDHATLRNTVDPPVRMWHNFGANTQTEPTYIISPATSRGWKQHFSSLRKVMDDLVENHHADPRRIYITGFSMGGSGTWDFIQQYPGYFAAAIPMGMNFQGDHAKVKDIPIWANRGADDHYAGKLPADIAAIRKLNGDRLDSSANWVTGVNPRFTSFENYGHGVQWVAASTQDLTGWAYSKINDGNMYPVIFFNSPAYKQRFVKGGRVKLEIEASDPDGSVSRIVVQVNGRKQALLTKKPYLVEISAPAGDGIITATAYDNKGKSSIATTIISSDLKPVFLTPELPFAKAGAYYFKKLSLIGNSKLRLSFADSTNTPPGLKLTLPGILCGVPEAPGTYSITIVAKGKDGDSTHRTYRFRVFDKNPDEIMVTNIVNDSGVHFTASKLRIGALTHFNKNDDEITVSNTGGYDGITYIPGNAIDTARSSANYLRFEVDQPARVLVAYEKKDHLFASTIPGWLKTWHKVPSQQIVAQYFYFDLFYRDFEKGLITLPGADERKNNISNNYFVLVSKQASPFRFSPVINSVRLNDGVVNVSYDDNCSALYGAGKLHWRILNGNLPPGLTLSEDGSVQGTPELSGSFRFTVMAEDEKSNSVRKEMLILIKNQKELYNR